MNNRKFQVAVAALLLGSQLATPAAAALSRSDLQSIETYVEAGQVEAMRDFLADHPEVLELRGAIGGALKAFEAHPNAKSLARISDRGGEDLAVTLADAAALAGISIY